MYACAKCYTMDERRTSILAKFHPINGMANCQQVTTDEEPTVEKMDDKSPSVNDSPVDHSSITDDNELINEESSPLPDEEHPLDFTTSAKKLWQSNDDEKSNSPGKTEQPENSDLQKNLKENEKDQLQLSLTYQNLANSQLNSTNQINLIDSLNSTRQLISTKHLDSTKQFNSTNAPDLTVNQPTNLKQEPNDSRTAFSGNLANQMNELTDWNNNSLPSNLNGNLSSDLNKDPNKDLNINDLDSDDLNILKYREARLDQNSLNALKGLASLNGRETLNDFGKQMPEFSVPNRFGQGFSDGPLSKKTKFLVKNWSD